MPSENGNLFGGTFLGREHEREGLRRWLRHSWRSAVAVLGPPGIGKTALIRKVADESRERNRPFVWLSGSKLRSVDDLWTSLRPPLSENRQFKSVVVVLDDLDAFAAGSQREADRLHETLRSGRYERRRETPKDFHGDLSWLLVGRKLPWQTFPDERRWRRPEFNWELLDEPPFSPVEHARTVVLEGLRESEIAELLNMSLRDGTLLPSKSRVGLATLQEPPWR